VHLNLGGGNFKAQFRRADRSGACVAVILGDGELDRGVVAVKTLRREAGQSECALADVAGRVQSVLEEESWTTT
jgi:histidyl-tRNA synthetase